MTGSGPAAVIFDLDGVLIDSEEAWDETRRAIAAEHGRAWPGGATAAMQGMSAPEWSSYMRDVVGIARPAGAISADVVARLLSGYEARLPLIEGAIATVRAIGTRWPLGLASSSNREVIDVVLAVSGLREDFGAVVSSEEVARGKPAPDVYLEAARQLSVSPAECVAIEDSSNGIRSAAAAGMAVVAVPHAAFPPAADALERVAATVPRIQDVTADLLQRVAAG